LGAEQTPDVDRMAVTSLLGGSDAGDERDASFSGLLRAVLAGSVRFSGRQVFYRLPFAPPNRKSSGFVT
jgi:hypothetical protein